MRELLFYTILLAMCIATLKDPFKGLLCYTFINIIRPELFFWGQNDGALAFKALFLCTVVSFFARRGRIFAAAAYREVWLLLWFFIAVVVSMLFSSWSLHPMALYHANEIFKLFVYIWMLVGILENQELVWKFQNLYLTAFTLLAIWGCDQHFMGNSRLEGLGGNAFPDSNGLAAILVMALPLAYSKLLVSSTRKGKALALVSMLFIALTIVFTQSRGGFLGLATCIVLCFLHSKGKIKFLAAAAVLLMLASPFIDTAYLERISGMAEDDIAEKDGSAGSRLVLWDAAALMFKDKPLFGHGFMTFARAKAPYQSQLEGKYPEKLLNYAFEPYKVCHGTYFNLLAEGGLFLAVPYFLLVGGYLWRYYRNRSRIIRSGAEPESVYLLQGIAIGVASHCVSIMTIDSQMDIFMPIQLVCGGILLRCVLQQVDMAEPELKLSEGAV